jgi:hypothetical protein
MFARVTLVIIVLIFSSGDLSAQEKHTAARVGELVVLKMSGKAAEEYATRSGMPKKGNLDLSRLSISTTGTIAQHRADGKYRIECSSAVENSKNTPRMLTLTAIVDPTQLKSEITPKATAVYASPADAKSGKPPKLTESAGKLLHVEFSDLENIKLRTWALVDEVGN